MTESDWRMSFLATWLCCFHHILKANSMERSMTRLKNKVAIITGAGTGLGKAGAQLFAQEGARVVVAEISRSLGEETAAAINAAGNEALFVPTDVSDPESVAGMVARAVEVFGRVDV